VFEWFGKFASNPQCERRMIELMLEGECDTEEFKQLSDNESLSMMTIGPPIVAPCQGIFFGGIGGALCRLDSTISVSASHCAIYGILLGMLTVPFIAAVIFAIVIPVDKTQTIRSRVVRRGWMLASPLFVFPVAWYCLKWTLQRGAKIAE